MVNKVVCESRLHANVRPDNREWYAERTDRNLGWITEAEQKILRNSVIGIAGCGGMGGLLASTMVRLGVGEIRIADSEEFDISNINRQFGASASTINKSKALETGRMLREITEDVRIVIYHEGITETTVSEFSTGCDFICDEIELMAVGSRMILHREAVAQNIPVSTCASVGFGTRFFLFDHTGMSIEDMHGMDLDMGMRLQTRLQKNIATAQEIRYLIRAVLDALIPNLTGYFNPDSAYADREACIRRLLVERKAPIIATNPSMASGFAANQVLLWLLNQSKERKIVAPPKTPGYLYFDAALMIARSVELEEVENGEY